MPSSFSKKDKLLEKISAPKRIKWMPKLFRSKGCFKKSRKIKAFNYFGAQAIFIDGW